MFKASTSERRWYEHLFWSQNVRSYHGEAKSGYFQNNLGDYLIKI